MALPSLVQNKSSLIISRSIMQNRKKKLAGANLRVIARCMQKQLFLKKCGSGEEPKQLLNQLGWSKRKYNPKIFV